MLTQEVAVVHTPSALLVRQCGERPTVLDGRNGQSWGDGSGHYSADPVSTLIVWPEAEEAVSPLASLGAFVDRQFSAGCVGIAVALSYDLKHWIERLPRRLPWPRTPVIYAAAYDWTYRVDYREGRGWLIAGNESARRAAMARIGEVAPAASRGRLAAPPAVASMRREDYFAMVERTKAYIAAGDIYQANLSQSFRTRLPLDRGRDLFERWTAAFPTPFAAYIDGGDWALVSNSPECFLDVRGDSIATFPIKGTRQVGNEMKRTSLAKELATAPKDLAEHLMIVDLERNDLGRICVPGSVVVPEFRSVKNYPLLLHMVSEVRGTLRPGVALAEMIAATFPGGSITGAPKVRAMEIIEELEPEPRGFYTGSIGWLECDGRARFNIAIRTAQLDSGGLTFHCGGGIVADSHPEEEFEEIYAKAQSLFRVLAESDGARPEGRDAR